MFQTMFKTPLMVKKYFKYYEMIFGIFSQMTYNNIKRCKIKGMLTQHFKRYNPGI